MNTSGLKTARLWYVAAFLFAISATVLFFHRDILNGCFWLIMSALGVIFATTKGNGDDEGCSHPSHPRQQAP